MITLSHRFALSHCTMCTHTLTFGQNMLAIGWLVGQVENMYDPWAHIEHYLIRFFSSMQCTIWIPCTQMQTWVHLIIPLETYSNFQVHSKYKGQCAICTIRCNHIMPPHCNLIALWLHILCSLAIWLRIHIWIFKNCSPKIKKQNQKEQTYDDG